MDDLRTRLQEVHERARPAPGAFDRLVEHRDRRLRRRKVGALLLAFALGVAVASIVGSVVRTPRTLPADEPTPTIGPARPETVDALEAPFDPRVRLEFGSAWTASPGLGLLTLTRDLPEGGRAQVFVWHLPSLRPFDPLTGRPAAASADRERWFRRFRSHVIDVGLFPDVNRVGSGSEWHWHPPDQLLWLLSFEGVIGPHATDAGMAGQRGPALGFGRATPATVLRAPEGDVELAPGTYWVWRSARPLPIVVGWAALDGADPEVASAHAWEVLRTISLPRIAYG